MLKLLKHDIKDSYLEVLAINGLLIALSAFVLLSGKTDKMFLLVISLGAWVVVLGAACCMLLVFIIKSFHTKLFSDYGYLTLTTPVSIDKILLSKIIVNLLWVAAVYISVIVSALIVVSSFSTLSIFSSFFEWLTKNPLETFKLVVSGLVSALNLIMTLIFVLVLVNTGRMKKHKFLKGLLIYIAVVILVSLTNPFETTFISLFTGGNMGRYLAGIAVSLAWSVVFYLISRYIITHKLELE